MELNLGSERSEIDDNLDQMFDAYQKGLGKYLADRLAEYDPSIDDVLGQLADTLAKDTPYVSNLAEALKCLKQLACSCRTGLKCPENLSDIAKSLAGVGEARTDAADVAGGHGGDCGEA